MNAPCFECPHHTPECHSTCEKYKQYAERCEEARKEREAVSDYRGYVKGAANVQAFWRHQTRLEKRGKKRW